MGRLTIEQIIEHCEKTTKQFEEKVSDLFPIERTQSNRYWEHKQVAEYLKELQRYKDLEEQGRLIETPETGIGDLSDGYHTFNELYHHRAVLFSVICNAFKSCAWKSKMHSDGTMYDGMFIVGVDTPKGSATYHYDIEPYWDMFDVKELDKAPEWDGHTPDDAINRIAELGKSNRLIDGDKLIMSIADWQMTLSPANNEADVFEYNMLESVIEHIAELKELEGVKE